MPPAVADGPGAYGGAHSYDTILIRFHIKIIAYKSTSRRKAVSRQDMAGSSSMLVAIIVLLARQARAAANPSAHGLLFVSFEPSHSPGASAASPVSIVSVTLHDSGQTTGPLPLESGASAFQDAHDSNRISYSRQDHSVVVVLATAVSSIDPGAGRPIAFFSQVNSRAAILGRDP